MCSVVESISWRMVARVYEYNQVCTKQYTVEWASLIHHIVICCMMARRSPLSHTRTHTNTPAHYENLLTLQCLDGGGERDTKQREGMEGEEDVELDGAVEEETEYVCGRVSVCLLVC